VPIWYNRKTKVITGRRFLAENPLLASKKKIKINKERKEHD
jgi:hypothetical protein